jgi:hypothetical protein
MKQKFESKQVASTVTEDPVPALVAQVYEESPLALRSRLLEHLLKPLGLLSLAAVANGLFARITLSNGWSQLQVKAEDASQVNAGDVIALVHHVQQVSAPALLGLTKVISTSPVLAGSAAAAMLLTVLARQAKQRSPVVDNDFDPIV